MNELDATRRFHLISGLPRSGSTLLVALLRQNPLVTASVTSPVLPMIEAIRTSMSGEFAANGDNEDTLSRCIKGAVNGYYADGGRREIVFDTNRAWSGAYPLASAIFGPVKILCCVRRPSEVFASFERVYRENPLRVSRLYNDATRGNLYSRFEHMFSHTGVIGSAIASLDEGVNSWWRNNILIVDYHDLVDHPADVMKSVYGFLEERYFSHDFQEVEFAREQLDNHLSAPGLHDVPKGIRKFQRAIDLPDEMARKADALRCW